MGAHEYTNLRAQLANAVAHISPRLPVGCQVIEPKLLLSDEIAFRDLAFSDRQNKVVVWSLSNDRFLIVLRTADEEVGLGAGDGSLAPLIFDDLEACVRVAIGLSRAGEIFFEARH